MHRATVRTVRSYSSHSSSEQCLYDVALLSAMYGMFAGAAHAFALIRNEDIDPAWLAPLLADWLVAMAPSVHETAERLHSGGYTKGVVSPPCRCRWPARPPS